MKPFDHHLPTSLGGVFELISKDENRKSHIYAGGTDLNLKLKSGSLVVEGLISLKKLTELKSVKFDEIDGLKLGAMTTLRDLQRNNMVNKYYPALSQAAGLMASEQIRSFATIGGNLCNAAPSADLAPPLIALDAVALIRSINSERKISLENFFVGPGETVLKTGEILTYIELPPPKGETLFIKHAPRKFMDISVVCIAIRMSVNKGICEEIRIVLGAVAPVPLRMHNAEEVLSGQSLNADNMSKAAQISADECTPIDDIRGSASYRRRMVEVLVGRGLNALNNKLSKA